MFTEMRGIAMTGDIGKKEVLETIEDIEKKEDIETETREDIVKKGSIEMTLTIKMIHIEVIIDVILIEMMLQREAPY